MPIFTQYKDNSIKIFNEGVWVYNERTGQQCLTLPKTDYTIDVGNAIFPIDTTRKSYWKAAIAELLGYIRGYRNAEDFAAIGAKTWFKDANENPPWLANPFRQGENDIGLIYGALTKDMPVLSPNPHNPEQLIQVGSRDILNEIYQDLKNRRDNRFEIWTFLSYPTQHLGTINPCLHTHQFTVIGDYLYLSSSQRSGDHVLGINFNLVQMYTLLALMAQITGLKPRLAELRVNNTHIYLNHLEDFKNQIYNNPMHNAPVLKINPKIKTLEDLRTWVTTDDFELEGYEHSTIDWTYEMFTGKKA